jgi:hypothetical protein
LSACGVAKEIPLQPRQPQQALTAVADAYRAFVKSQKVNDRISLGLPRSGMKVDFGPPAGLVTRHPTSVHFHLAQSSSGLVLRAASFEIDKLVRGPEFFQQIEETLRKSLTSDSPVEPAQPRGPRAPARPSHDRERGGVRPAHGFVKGGYARLEGMRVTIREIRGRRAIVQLPGSDEPEEVDLDELDPYYPG